MAEPIQPPPPPSSVTPTTQGVLHPIKARVLDEARARLGQRELGGQNRGPIVEEVCRPFVSPGRFQRMYDAGKLEWCAAFSCFCWWRAWPEFRPLVSLGCNDLWANLTTRGWTRLRGQGEPPGPADFIFFRKRSGTGLRHVELVVTIGKAIHRIGGNTWRERGDTGSVQMGTSGPDDPLIHGYATIILPG